MVNRAEVRHGRDGRQRMIAAIHPHAPRAVIARVLLGLFVGLMMARLLACSLMHLGIGLAAA